MPRKKKPIQFIDPTMPKVKFIDLGPTEDLASYNPEDMDFNFVGVHRHNEWIVQKWGNFCSKIVSHLVNRDVYGGPIRWYHKMVFNFCYAQYDKYGDYYRIIDNTFGDANTDGIREVR